MKPTTLLGVTAILGGGLYVLFQYGPHQQPGVAEPSALALSYLEKEVAANPKNIADRLRLARMQLSVGRTSEAAVTLSPLLDLRVNTKLGREARALLFEVEHRRFGDTPPDDPARPQRLQAARAALSRILDVDGPSLAEPEWEGRAKQRLALDEPAGAAAAYEAMAEKFPHNRIRWRQESARWYEAAGNLEKGADQLYQASRETTDRAQAATLALAGLKARRASGEPAAERAMAEAKDLRVRFPEDDTIKLETQPLVDVAEYEENKPHGDEAKLNELLGTGKIKTALTLLRKMVKEKPGDPERRRWLALVARWNSEPELSLENWYALAQLGRPEGITEGLPVARALYDHEKVVALLEMKAKQGPLSAEEVYELANRHETLGSPEAALAALETYGKALRKEPRYFRTRMALQETRDRPDDAFDELLAMQSATGLSIEDVVAGMELLWKHDQPARALEFGRSQRVLATPSDVAFWKVLGDVAYAESAFADAHEAYALLARNPTANPPRVVFERLLQMTGADGKVAEQAEFAKLGYDRHHEPEWVMQAMDVAYAKERWDTLKDLLDLAKKEESKIQVKKMFWRVRAATVAVGDQDALAEEYLQRAAAPGDNPVDLHRELLRLSVSRKDPAAIQSRVAEYGAELEADPPSFYSLHEAYELLGNAERSEFFRRKARNHEFSVDEASLSRPANTRTNTDGALLPAEVRMEMALEEKQWRAVRAILDEPGATLAKTTRIEAEHELGRDERAVAPLRSLKADAAREGAESPAAKALSGELAATHHDLVDMRGGRLGAELSSLQLGDLRVDEAKAFVALPWQGLPGTVGAVASVARLHPMDELALQVENTNEYFAGLTFRRDVWWGATEIQAGMITLEDGTYPKGRIAQSFRPGRGTDIRLGAFYHQHSLHSSLLRASGFANGAELDASHAFAGGNRIELGVEGLRFTSHEDGLIAWGLHGRCVDAQEWDLGKVHLSIEGIAEFLLTRKATTVPSGLPIPDEEFDTVLPDRYLMAGPGVVLSSEGQAVGSGVGRPHSLHYSVEGQGGLLWPGTRPWGGAAAGVGWVLPHFQEVFLRGHYYSSYGGLAGQRYAGLTLGYVLRWL